MRRDAPARSKAVRECVPLACCCPGPCDGPGQPRAHALHDYYSTARLHGLARELLPLAVEGSKLPSAVARQVRVCVCARVCVSSGVYIQQTDGHARLHGRLCRGCRRPSFAFAVRARLTLALILAPGRHVQRNGRPGRRMRLCVGWHGCAAQAARAPCACTTAPGTRRAHGTAVWSFVCLAP